MSSFFIFVILIASFHYAICDFWPKSFGADKTVDATIKVNASQTFDCKFARYIPNPSTLGDGGEKERQKAVFELADKATIANCIIGAKSGTSGSSDGIHCKGSCTLKNVWFEDVGEDAATFYGLSSDSLTYTVEGGGAKNAQDKVFQHNGKGTVRINNFWVDTFTRFFRSCGNCENQYARHVVIKNLTALNGVSGQFIAGINFNYGDSATLSQIKLGGSTAKKVAPCKRFVGVTSGESKSNGTNPDGKYCIYKESDITYL